MSDKTDYITVEAEKTDLNALLEIVKTQQRPIRIVSHGHAVAEISPVLLKRFGPPDPKLRAEILVPGHEVTTEEDWPEEYR